MLTQTNIALVVLMFKNHFENFQIHEKIFIDCHNTISIVCFSFEQKIQDVVIYCRQSAAFATFSHQQNCLH